jgi:hypothetical protein
MINITREIPITIDTNAMKMMNTSLICDVTPAPALRRKKIPTPKRTRNTTSTVIQTQRWDLLSFSLAVDG